jgi:hypothetical protein
MAVNVDTVYQRVLSISNKEKRGYVTPLEFNLFANQAQLDIFNQYFYDLGQFNRLPKYDLEYSDSVAFLEEKMSIFEVFSQTPLSITNNLVRLDSSETGTGTVDGSISSSTSVVLDATTGSVLPGMTVTGSGVSSGVTIDAVALNTPSNHTTLTLSSASSISDNVALTFDFNNPEIYQLGNVYYTLSGVDYEVEEITRKELIQYNLSPLAVPTTKRPVFIRKTNSGNRIEIYPSTISSDITYNYIKKPAAVSWTGTVVNDVSLYNSTTSTNFELHESEETNLVIKILALAGILLEDPQLYQVSSQEEIKKVQQEKA